MHHCLGGRLQQQAFLAMHDTQDRERQALQQSTNCIVHMAVSHVTDLGWLALAKQS